MSKLFQWLLWIISSVVAIGLSKHYNMWGWIVAYWSVLAFKNMSDFMVKK